MCYNKKSRTGCARCKSQKQKCDEGRPECDRCSRLGVACPGYSRPLVWSTKYEMHFQQEQTHKPTSKQLPTKTTKHPEHSEHPEHPELSNARDALSERSLPSSEATFTYGAKDDASIAYSNWDSSGSVSSYLDMFPDFGSAESYVNLVVPRSMGINTPPDCDVLPTPRTETSGNGSTLYSGFDIPLANGNGNGNGNSNNNCNNNNSFSAASSDEVAWKGLHGLQPVTSSPPTRNPQTQLPPVEDRRATGRDAGKFLPQPPSTPRLSLSAESAFLISHYFEAGCALFSCFDGPRNPFRSASLKHWASHPGLSSALQSVSAILLSQSFPQFKPLAKKVRQDAILQCREQAEMNEQKMLSLVILGQSVSWHDPKDFGISFYNYIQKHLNETAGDEKGASTSITGSSRQFFNECLTHWAMNLTFVADSKSMLPPLLSTTQVGRPVHILPPHPQTGICQEIQAVVRDIGALVRSVRTRGYGHLSRGQRPHIIPSESSMRAQKLYDDLVAIEPASALNISDTGDPSTPIWHLRTLAEVYRSAGLLQLYRTFPELLHAHLPAQESTRSLTQALGVMTTDPYSIPVWPQESEPPEAQHHDSDCANNSTWLRLADMAICTLELLKSIPFESHTRSSQPLLLLLIAGDLRLANHNCTVPGPDDPNFSPDLLDLVQDCDFDKVPTKVDWPLDARSLRVVSLRRFVLGRLGGLQHVMPSRPIKNCESILKSTWEIMDEADPEVYWMDVMMEKKLDMVFM